MSTTQPAPEERPIATMCGSLPKSFSRESRRPAFVARITAALAQRKPRPVQFLQQNNY